MSLRRTPPQLDLRSPYVLDTHELGRRAGSMLRVSRTLSAPADWRLELVGVPPGAEVMLDLRLESVMEGVLVTGTVSAPVNAECGRCLDPVATDVVAPVQELFAYEPAPGEDDVLLIDGDFIDLEPLLRDAVVLALPLNPVCSPDCSGLCTGCGERLADLPSDHRYDDADPRWAALAALQSPEET